VALRSVREIYGADAIDLPLTVVVELRGEFDTSHHLAEQDAEALYRFLTVRGAIQGKAKVPKFTGLAAPFSATQTLRCPAAGIVVFTANLGDMVDKGQVLAEIIDPLADPDNAIAGQIIAADAGRFFAHANQRLAWPGEVVGKLQCKKPLPDRKGKLLYD
jgi:predicted deacylase